MSFYRTPFRYYKHEEDRYYWDSDDSGDEGVFRRKIPIIPPPKPTPNPPGTNTTPVAPPGYTEYTNPTIYQCPIAVDLGMISDQYETFMRYNYISNALDYRQRVQTCVNETNGELLNPHLKFGRILKSDNVSPEEYVYARQFDTWCEPPIGVTDVLIMNIALQYPNYALPNCSVGYKCTGRLGSFNILPVGVGGVNPNNQIQPPVSFGARNQFAFNDYWTSPDMLDRDPGVQITTRDGPTTPAANFDVKILSWGSYVNQQYAWRFLSAAMTLQKRNDYEYSYEGQNAVILTRQIPGTWYTFKVPAYYRTDPVVGGAALANFTPYPRALVGGEIGFKRRDVSPNTETHYWAATGAWSIIALRRHCEVEAVTGTIGNGTYYWDIQLKTSSLHPGGPSGSQNPEIGRAHV